MTAWIDDGTGKFNNIKVIALVISDGGQGSIVDVLCCNGVILTWRANLRSVA